MSFWSSSMIINLQLFILQLVITQCQLMQQNGVQHLHGLELGDFDVSDRSVLDQFTSLLLNDGAQGNLLPIWDYSVQRLAEFLRLLSVDDVPHHDHLVRVLCQLFHLHVSKAKLRIKQRLSQMVDLLFLDVLNCVEDVHGEVATNATLQDGLHLLVTEPLIDFLLGALKDDFLEYLNIGNRL